MTGSGSMGFVAFLREAKRRKVYVSVVAYLGVSVVLIELAGPVAEALLFPEWTSRLVTFLLLLGFPVVLVLAWTFDITGKGLVRTSDVDRMAAGTLPGAATETPHGAAQRAGPTPSTRPGPSSSTSSPSLTSRNRGPRVSMPAPRRRRPLSPAPGEEGGEEEGVPPDPERVRRATLAHMRHELRTPINGIIGYAEMLLEDVEEEGYTEDLGRIRAGGGKLLGLIDQVLGEGAPGNPEKDLESYGREIRAELRIPINSVVGYAEMLLETAQEDGREDLIPDLERIHASAHRLLELSGDIVGLATAGGQAPMVEGSEASDLTRTVLSKIQPDSDRGRGGEAEGRLLVVDDNATNRDLVSRQLARQGYIVLTASDGAEALELLESKAVDLILLDVIMPNLDGVETLKRLKAHEKLQEIPVLMLSSLDEVDGALRCVEMGAEDYLSKPVKPAVLEARITANLELFRMRERERAFQERAAADEIFIQELLMGAYPQAVADRIRAGDSEVADMAPEATVLSCSLRGFSVSSSPGALSEGLKLMRPLYSAVEELASEHGVETCIWRPLGFLAVAGAPSPAEDHVERAAALGRALLSRVSTLQGPGAGGWRMGLGLHTGPVVGATLGDKRLRYEVWGEGVTTAEGVARVAPDGALLASPPVHARLKDRVAFEPQKVRDVAGVQMRTYLLRDGIVEE